MSESKMNILKCFFWLPLHISYFQYNVTHSLWCQNLNPRPLDCESSVLALDHNYSPKLRVLRSFIYKRIYFVFYEVVRIFLLKLNTNLSKFDFNCNKK